MKSFAYKLGIVVGTIGLVSGCGSSSGSSVSGSGASSVKKTGLAPLSPVSGSVQKEGSAGIGTRNHNGGEILSTLKDKAAKYTEDIQKAKNGSDLRKTMEYLSKKSELSNDLIFVVDVYFYKNGKEGEMDWWTGAEMYSKNGEFYVKGVKQNDDIWYSSGDFPDYYNIGEYKYSFKNARVVLSPVVMASNVDIKGLTGYLKECTPGMHLYNKMKELSKKPEFSDNMIFTVDVYHQDRWWSSKKMVYSSSYGMFLVYGVRKDADGSENPIKYSLQDFNDYYNEGDDREFKFKELRVTSEKYISAEDIASISKMIRNNDATGLTHYVNNATSGTNLYYRMKALSDSEAGFSLAGLTFSVNIYYHGNGEYDGPMGWFHNREMLYNNYLDKFVVGGVRKNAYHPIGYTSEEFDKYYNKGNKKYSFRGIHVVNATVLSLQKMISNNDTSSLTGYIKGAVDGKDLVSRMKTLVAMPNFLDYFSFTSDIYKKDFYGYVYTVDGAYWNRLRMQEPTFQILTKGAQHGTYTLSSDKLVYQKKPESEKDKFNFGNVKVVEMRR